MDESKLNFSFTIVYVLFSDFRYVEQHSPGVNHDDMKVSAQDGQTVKLSNAEKNGHLIYVGASFPGIDESKFRVSFLITNR